MDILLNPPGLADYAHYFQTLLGLAGTLFGLAFAALIFVMQSGFSSFKFTRRMFLEYYVLFGRNLLVTLAYLTIISLGALYLNSRILLSTIFYLSLLVFVKTFLDYYKHVGYMHTLFSKKYIPKNYGAFRAYFRYIRNLGFFRMLYLLLGIIVFWVYPILISWGGTNSFIIDSKGLYYSTLLLLVYSILRITNFIPQFFDLSNQEIESQITSEDNSVAEKSLVDYKKEKIALKEYLSAHGIVELDFSTPTSFLDGELTVNLLTDDRPEAWFNVNVQVSDVDVFEVRTEVCNYAFKVFKLLHNSMVDVNSFVLSFHIKIDGDTKYSRNIFFRSNRSELDKIFSRTADDPVTMIRQIENRLFDELFRDLV